MKNKSSTLNVTTQDLVGEHSLQWPIQRGSAEKDTIFRLQSYQRVGILEFMS